MGRGNFLFGAHSYLRHLLSVGAAVCLLNAFSSAQATPIATWTFETSQPSGTGAAAGPYAPEVGLGSATGLHASSAAVYSSPAGDGSAHSFSSNTWATGDYYQFEVSTATLSNILLNWDQTSSSTGPRDYQLEYSTDGLTFTNFGSVYEPLVNGSPNVAWTSATYNAAYHFSVDLSSVAAIDNQATVYFRLAMADTTSENGGTVAPTGTDRVDNFSVSPVPVPEPSSAVLAMLTIAAAFACAKCPRLWRAVGFSAT